MLRVLDQMKNSTQLRWNKVHRFKAKINLYIEVGAYIIKTAETYAELIESFRLRDEVFNQEFRGIEKAGLDFDKYDYYFDHLIIVHRETNKIIGTYRLSCTNFSKYSYTALEFKTSFIDDRKEIQLELGRACIHKNFRKGAVISLLWRGIAEYMNLSESSLLFGCSSLKINNARDAALVYIYLVNNNYITLEFASRPTKKFTMRDLPAWIQFFSKGLTPEQNLEAESLLPSLLKSYLKLGAKVASVPAFDEEFDCIDLLTVLKKENLAKALGRKFQVA